MKKSLSEDVGKYLEALQRIYCDSRCSVEDKRKLRMLYNDLSGMARIVDQVLQDFGVEPTAKMGRHARPDQKEWQHGVDAMFAGLLESHWHGSDGRRRMSFTTASEYAGELLAASGKTARNAYFRHKRKDLKKG